MCVRGGKRERKKEREKERERKRVCVYARRRKRDSIYQRLINEECRSKVGEALSKKLHFKGKID